MSSVVLLIHLFLALAIIALVLLQRSEGGGLGLGGSGGLGSFASPQSTASALTRATGICAALFFVTSLVLGVMSGAHSQTGKLTSALEKTGAAQTAPAVPAGAGAKEEPKPEQPPTAPVSK